MRTSKDIWILPNGEKVSIDQMTEPPTGATVYDGYDYEKQCWMYHGEKDTRTIEQIRATINF